MDIKVFKEMPADAAKIRKEVFVKEQGFCEEFDGQDLAAIHFVAYTEDEIPVGTCRLFQDEDGNYVVGRVAVIKEYRGSRIGERLLKEAEGYVSKSGGRTTILHAQCRVVEFYEKLGYQQFGGIENEEGCPHIWMRKVLV